MLEFVSEGGQTLPVYDRWDGPMDLLIRAGRDDNRLIEQLCAPAVAGLWSPRSLPLTGLVIDATTALARPKLRSVAERAGLPLLVDPLTTLLQDEQAPDHPWARLPFATARKITPNMLADQLVQDRLIHNVISFQREHGATGLIPPYLYCDKRDSAWFELNLQLLRRTARYLERENIGLPVAPVFAGSLHEFGPVATWHDGIDRVTAIADAMHLRHFNLSLSWTGARQANYPALAMLMATGRHISRKRRTIAWRQGLYGAALTAAGLSGYETGPAREEWCHYPAYAANRRPADDDGNDSPKGAAYVYLAAFDRSVQRKAGHALLHDQQLRGSLVCHVEDCCPDGTSSMINAWREHAVRARRRALDELAKMPATSWRLNQIARDAERNATTARLATEVLRRENVKGTLPEQTFHALSRVADELRTTPGTQVA